jgi:hypothetical protein
MANKEHLQILKQAAEAWNRWREQLEVCEPDLGGANLSGADLAGRTQLALHRGRVQPRSRCCNRSKRAVSVM